MRIGFFTDSYNLKCLTGVDVSVESFRKELEDLDNQVFLYAPKVPDWEDKNPRVFRFRGIKVFKKPPMRLALPFLLTNPKKEKAKIDNKLDIVHTHSFFSMGLLGKYIAYNQKIPLIYTHHTFYTEYAKIYLKEKIISPHITKLWTKWYAAQADAIIAPSFKIKKHLENYGAKKPIFVLPTGVNLKLFKKSKKTKRFLRKKLGLPLEKKLLLFVGRIGKEKNPDFLVKMIKQLSRKRKDTILIMVGDGFYLKKLKTLVKNLGIDEFVKFIGRVAHQKISEYYQSSDVFVFSSSTETQGLVILEAMACELPIVVLEDQAFEGIVIDKKNGFIIKNKSISVFSDKINQILDNPLIYKKFSVSSQKIASGFSEKAQAQKLLKIYQKLILKNNKKI
ncbi:glycosyltransferase [Candidatus Parcubacteria bacterium]|nr:glycosyltransferase [Candidatus Parcubacteria bacterium]